jgi:hypothetical protein
MITRGVSHCGHAIYIKKYLKAKEELWKFKYFTVPKYDLQKYPQRETKILKDVITPCYSQVFTQAKISDVSKILILKETYYIGAKIP